MTTPPPPQAASSRTLSSTKQPRSQPRQRFGLQITLRTPQPGNTQKDRRRRHLPRPQLPDPPRRRRPGRAARRMGRRPTLPRRRHPGPIPHRQLRSVHGGAPQQRHPGAQRLTRTKDHASATPYTTSKDLTSNRHPTPRREFQVLMGQQQPKPHDYIPGGITRPGQLNSDRHAGLHLHESQASACQDPDEDHPHIMQIRAGGWSSLTNYAVGGGAPLAGRERGGGGALTRVGLLQLVARRRCPVRSRTRPAAVVMPLLASALSAHGNNPGTALANRSLTRVSASRWFAGRSS